MSDNVNGTCYGGTRNTPLTTNHLHEKRRIMAISSTKTTPNRRVYKFLEAKGKLIPEVELSTSPDFNVIKIVFQ